MAKGFVASTSQVDGGGNGSIMMVGRESGLRYGSLGGTCYVSNKSKAEYHLDEVTRSRASTTDLLGSSRISRHEY